MFNPKIKFSLIPIKLEVNLIYFFLFCEKWGWGEKIIKKNPGLKNVFSLKAEKKRKKYIEDYIANFRKKIDELLKIKFGDIQKNGEK